MGNYTKIIKSSEMTSNSEHRTEKQKPEDTETPKNKTKTSKNLAFQKNG